jgi:hypothetical protein
MHTMKQFSFVILQYRHDVWSGESLNVGVLLSCPETGFLELRGRDRADKRLTAVYPGLDRAGVGNQLRSMAIAITRMRQRFSAPLFSDRVPSAREAGEMLFPNSDAAFGWGRHGSGITPDPNVELDRLVHRYVTQFDDEQAAPARSDEDVFRPVKSLLLESGVADQYIGAKVHSDVYEVEFPYAYQNGVLHVVKPLSFDQTAAEGVLDKASNWSGKLVNLSNATRPFKPYLLLGHPTRPELRDAFSKAVEMLRRSAVVAHLKAEIIDEDQSERLGDMLIDVVKRSDHLHPRA